MLRIVRNIFYRNGEDRRIELYFLRSVKRFGPYITLVNVMVLVILGDNIQNDDRSGLSGPILRKLWYS